jgi:phi13 family phage major tail protein
LEGIKYAVLTESSDVLGGSPAYGTIYDFPGVIDLNWNPGASLTSLYADDGLAVLGETVGDMKLDITFSDISQQDLANILGNSYVNGILAGNTLDASPYIAIGGKILRNGQAGGSPVYEYVWFPKVKFTKPAFDYKTKEGKIVFQTAKLTGQVAKLAANGVYRTSVRTDDPSAIASTLTNWFTNVVTATTADLTALTVAVTTGTGATKTLLFTFSKASNSGAIPFAVPDASIAAMIAQVQVILASSGAVQACTYARLSAGTGFSNSPVTVVCTTPVAAAAVFVVIPANTQIVDSSGVAVSAYASGSVSTHA